MTARRHSPWRRGRSIEQDGSDREAIEGGAGLRAAAAFHLPEGEPHGCTQTGTLLLLSGHGLDLPKLPGVRQTGKFGLDMTLEKAMPPRARSR